MIIDNILTIADHLDTDEELEITMYLDANNRYSWLDKYQIEDLVELLQKVLTEYPAYEEYEL